MGPLLLCFGNTPLHFKVHLKHLQGLAQFLLHSRCSIHTEIKVKENIYDIVLSKKKTGYQILHIQKNSAKKYAIITIVDNFSFWFFSVFSKYSVMNTHSAVHAFLKKELNTCCPVSYWRRKWFVPSTGMWWGPWRSGGEQTRLPSHSFWAGKETPGTSTVNTVNRSEMKQREGIGNVFLGEATWIPSR